MDIFIYLFVALFSVLNPIGTVPIFVGLTQGYSASERSKTSLVTSINVFIILMISFFTPFFSGIFKEKLKCLILKQFNSNPYFYGFSIYLKT